VSGQKPREIAAQVLDQALAQDLSPTAEARGQTPSRLVHPPFSDARPRVFVEEILEAKLAGAHLAPVDRGLCQELVFGVIRWGATLDWLVSQRIKHQFPTSRLRNLLCLGLYQIFWLERIPHHAAVHETVELAKHTGFGAQTGFVNALLRGYLREYEATKVRLAELKISDPPLGFSHPAWLVSRWRNQWDAQNVATLMEWNNTPPKTFARVNLLKTEPGPLLALWRDEGVEYDFSRSDWFEENLVFELKSHPPLRGLGSFQKGFFYVQDPGTLLAVHILAPQPGETILDLCAAPGGKLTYAAQRMLNKGRLVAYDPSPGRRKLIQENCLRLGVTCAEIVSELPLSSSPGRFDRILVDAPCSNTGVMRRRVDLRWRIRIEEVERLRGVQLELLRQATSLLKPRGVLVYSTCSLEQEENRDVISQFLRERNEFEMEEERQLVPFHDKVDGAYVACLKASS
jgi:16S rRNA (cytosine967-C5)-methyltransferase